MTGVRVGLLAAAAGAAVSVAGAEGPDPATPAVAPTVRSVESAAENEYRCGGPENLAFTRREARSARTIADIDGARLRARISSSVHRLPQEVGTFPRGAWRVIAKRGRAVAFVPPLSGDAVPYVAFGSGARDAYAGSSFGYCAFHLAVRASEVALQVRAPRRVGANMLQFDTGLVRCERAGGESVKSARVRRIGSTLIVTLIGRARRTEICPSETHATTEVIRVQSLCSISRVRDGSRWSSRAVSLRRRNCA